MVIDGVVPVLRRRPLLVRLDQTLTNKPEEAPPSFSVTTVTSTTTVIIIMIMIMIIIICPSSSSSSS
jgi:hypothetical protein